MTVLKGGSVASVDAMVVLVDGVIDQQKKHVETLWEEGGHGVLRTL